MWILHKIKTYKKQILLLVGLVLGFILISQISAKAQHGHMTPVIGKYINMVLAGDVSGASDLFANNPNDPATHMLQERFHDRFVEQTSSLDLSKIEDPKVVEILEIYQAYWRNALMKVAPLDDLNASLMIKLDTLLRAEGYTSDLEDDDELWDNVTDFINHAGYSALSGKTPPLQELMVWLKNDTTIETIELTDGTIEIPVTSISDFISYGWSNFAAFGMTSTGGWTKEEGIYCLCGRQNRNNERFQTSFLKHEGRHYADFKLYPELQAADLEYRAKLTELAFSEDILYDLLTQFTNGAQKIENAPHPLANWYVVEGFSRHLRDGVVPNDTKEWEVFSIEEIHQTARTLLKEHDEFLMREGATITKGIILP